MSFGWAQRVDETCFKALNLPLKRWSENEDASKNSAREFFSGFWFTLIFKQNRYIISRMTTKQKFLEEHNKLSPTNLQATAFLLSRFKTEKPMLFKDNDWSIDKIRRPFVLWFTSLTIKEKGEYQNKK